MKKIICLIMALVMCMSVSVYAANETTSSTQVEYTGSREPSGGGDSSETIGEYYELIVPASMKPGETKEVSLSGYWPANRILEVVADENVVMQNANDGSKKTLEVTFLKMAEIGSNNRELIASSEVSVQAMDDVLFGSWSGVFTYSISMVSM